MSGLKICVLCDGERESENKFYCNWCIENVPRKYIRQPIKMDEYDEDGF